MSVNAIIFDMDGTMFDTETISVEAMQQVAKRYGVSVEYDAALEFLGLPREEIQKRFLQKFGQDFDYQNYRLDKIAYQNAVIQAKGVPLKPGLLELLEYAKNHGILCCVATSTSRERTEDLLQRAEVEHYFSAVICGEDVINGKPNPDIFLYAAERIGRKPEECVVIEDSRNGILAADRAEIFSILVPDLVPVDDEMRQAADLIFGSLLEVLEYIKKG